MRGFDDPLKRDERLPLNHWRRRRGIGGVSSRHHLWYQQRVPLSRLSSRQHGPRARPRKKRPLDYAIVDMISRTYPLVDEARTPLIISGPAEEAESALRCTLALLVKNLVAAPKADSDEEAGLSISWRHLRRKVPCRYPNGTRYRQSRIDAPADDLELHWQHLRSAEHPTNAFSG